MKLFGSKSLEGLTTLGSLRLESLCFSCTLTNLLMDYFGLLGHEEVFPLGFSVFPFDNTLVLSCVCILFPLTTLV